MIRASVNPEGPTCLVMTCLRSRALAQPMLHQMFAGRDAEIPRSRDPTNGGLKQ